MPAKHIIDSIEMITAVGLSLAVDEDSIHVKSRQRRRGSHQYGKTRAQKGSVRCRRAGPDSDALLVREGKARLAVNLQDYLDTGLFLDHPPIRCEIKQLASGKSFLNRLCYASAVAVQAALGEARHSLSVDMSNTYLDWSQRNFVYNHMGLSRHRLMREDCLKFLHLQSLVPDEKFDLIFLDPPSFSNSKKMQEVLDIQKDHVRLIQQAMRWLEPGGTLIFSTNLRKFKMGRAALREVDLENHTRASLDPDFQRNQKIHQCWKITSHYEL